MRSNKWKTQKCVAGRRFKQAKPNSNQLPVCTLFITNRSVYFINYRVVYTLSNRFVFLISYRVKRHVFIIYRQHPVDGEVDGFADGQQVDKWPNGRGDETDDDHEQEPVGTG